MNNLRNFIGSENDQVERYAQLKKGCDKEQTRDLEMQLLIPEKIQVHIGSQVTAKTSLDARTVCLVFPSNASIDLFKKYFRVSTYNGQTAHKLDLLIDFLQAIENGELLYDLNKKTFTST